MKKLYISICFLLASVSSFAQISTVPVQNIGTSQRKDVTDDFVANISSFNCNAAFVYFTYQGLYSSCYWDLGDGSYGSGIQVYHNYTQPGTYSVVLTVVYQGDTTVIAKPNLITIRNAPNVSYNYTVSDTLLFAPLTVSFTNHTVPGDGDTLNYSWDFGDSLTSHDTNATHTFITPGLYNVSLTVTDNYGCHVCYAHEIVVKDTAQKGEMDYITSGCGNDGPSPCGYIKHYEMQNDTVKIYGLTYENCCGTKTITINTTSDTIHIRKWNVGPLCTCSCGFCFAIDIPNIKQDSIYVDFDGEVVLVTKLMHAIEEPNPGQNLVFYPNPATDNLTIEVLQKSTIDILNMEGQIVKTIKEASSKVTVDLKALSSGVYMVKIRSDKGIVIKKFIKE